MQGASVEKGGGLESFPRESFGKPGLGSRDVNWARPVGRLWGGQW